MVWLASFVHCSFPYHAVKLCKEVVKELLNTFPDYAVKLDKEVVKS